MSTELTGSGVPPKELSPRYRDAVLGAAFLGSDSHHYIHLKGPRSEYRDLVQYALEIVPHIPIRYTRSWHVSLTIKTVSRMPRVPMTLGSRIAHLAVIGACFFILGLVAQAVASAP